MKKNYSLIDFSKILALFIYLLNTEILTAQETIFNNQRFPQFPIFLSKFSKHYKSQQEYNQRQIIYTSNIVSIKNSGCISCGVNFYTDWTISQIEDEIKSPKFINKTQSGRILTQKLPSSFDWRKTTPMTNVKNIGYCGASWVFSTVAFFQQQSIINGLANQSLDLSEQYLIACIPQNQGCNAGNIESSIEKVINQRGLPYESKYPYNLKTTSSDICFEKDVFLISETLRISYYKVSNPRTIEMIILKKPAIVAVCGADFSFYFPNNSSNVLKCQRQNRIIDHSVLLVGFTQNEWIIKNHWGKDWGIDGYAYISKNPSEDCCIGEQIHTTGLRTQNCSVQYCQNCVEANACQRCKAGRYVKYHQQTGTQTCELCTENNCAQCYNYKGTCKWCFKDYAINSSTGLCVPKLIDNCHKFQTSKLCLQCFPGYKLNSDQTACDVYCSVKNCVQCSSGACTECVVGFTLANEISNNQRVQFCYLNKCVIFNCIYCNQNGACILCGNGFTLQSNGSCITNCTKISNCVSCSATSNVCGDCAEGYSWNSMKKICQVFNGTSNCWIHRTTCTICRIGYAFLSLTKQCVQSCYDIGCAVCVKSDNTLCLKCANGYYMNETIINNITYSTICIANVCNILNCSICGVNGSCISCSTKYLYYNQQKKKCQSLCSMPNCRDCLSTNLQCDFCNVGYCVDYIKKNCVPCNITNCLISDYQSGQLICDICEDDYYLNINSTICFIYCLDYYCESCQIATYHICEKCRDGFFPLIKNNILACTYTIPIMKGCLYITYNQSYCYECKSHYIRNKEASICHLRTNCPQQCQFCSDISLPYFQCKCKIGVFQQTLETCIQNPLKDDNCFVVSLQSGKYYCLSCLEGYLVNVAMTGCDPICVVSNCEICENNFNYDCFLCQDGYFLTQGLECKQCPFQNCKKCQENSRCIDCMLGYELDFNQRSCSKIQCLNETFSNSYECVCPISTYFQSQTCKPCSQNFCAYCNSINCIFCENGYYLTNQSTCKKCIKNCQQCKSIHKCQVCDNGFFFDKATFQCLNLDTRCEIFHVSGNFAVRCPDGCQTCGETGYCLQCVNGYTIIEGLCFACKSQCKQCLPSNISYCIKCQKGHFLNKSNTCERCSDKNCKNCQSSKDICMKCQQKFYIKNGRCFQCPNKFCLNCNPIGSCILCMPGFILMNDSSCQQCGGNCKTCNSNAINQCDLACNQTQFLINGQCENCPLKCNSCNSAEVCSSCMIGYYLKQGFCRPVCAEGCFQCDQVSPQLCKICFGGYTLSAANQCQINIDCNNNNSCTLCPLGMSLDKGRCQYCNSDEYCLQCMNGNVDFCILCKNGFYLNNGICHSCANNCKNCAQLNQCFTCKDGFSLPSDVISGDCFSCDSMCKTCKGSQQTCTSCFKGFELSVQDKCLRQQKIAAKIQLDAALKDFLKDSFEVRNELIRFIGQDYELGSHYYTIINIQEGSTLLDFTLAIPQNEDPDIIFTKFKNLIESATRIGGFSLIAVKKVELYKPSTKNNGENTEEINDSKGNKTSNLAIILGVTMPTICFIFCAIIFFYRRCLINSDNLIVNISGSVILEQNSNLKETKIKTRIVLPPIKSRYGSSCIQKPQKQLQTNDNFSIKQQINNSMTLLKQQSSTELKVLGQRDKEKNLELLLSNLEDSIKGEINYHGTVSEEILNSHRSQISQIEENSLELSQQI